LTPTKYNNVLEKVAIFLPIQSLNCDGQAKNNLKKLLIIAINLRMIGGLMIINKQ